VLNHSEILDVQMAANSYFDGRTVYISGLPYSAENARLLHRAVLWACGKEGDLHKWYSSNPNTELHVYPQAKQYCVVNNIDVAQETTVYAMDKKPYALSLAKGEIKWFDV
jgi:1,3-beta-galactosyl-N-acetylhexosamine phosphorylase